MNRLCAWVTRNCTFQNALVAGLVLTLAAFLGVLFSEWIETKISGQLDIAKKSDILKFVGIAMGGILVALQALASHRRAKALEDTAGYTEQGQRQERLKNAIEHLGHRADSVHLGGAYELVHLAEDTATLRQTVLDILCAHIRQTTGCEAYRREHSSKPSEEVQSILTLLFVKNHEIFRGLHVNLKESYLNGADIREAHLEKAVLTRAHLQGTILYMAHLQKANFREAYLQGANIENAHLQAADFINARMHETQLFGAHLQGAQLFGAQLQGARLYTACLQGARLGGVELQGADLSFAHLEGVSGMLAPDAFADRIRQQIGSESDLSGVVFAGGLSQEDVDSLVDDLSNKEAKELREKLESHIGEPESSELPRGFGHIFTGTYTEEEAEKWIAEYEEAMSGIQEDDS